MYEMVECISNGAKAVRRINPKLMLNHSQIKKEKQQRIESTLKVQKFIKKLVSHPDDERHDEQARDIITKNMRIVRKQLDKLNNAYEIENESKKKLDLVIKAFVIDNMVLFCDGLSEQKSIAVQNLIDALHLPQDRGSELEGKLHELESCMEGIAGMLPEDIYVSEMSPETVAMLLKAEDWVKVRTVQQPVKTLGRWADIVDEEKMKLIWKQLGREFG